NGNYRVRLTSTSAVRVDGGSCVLPGPLDGCTLDVTLANSGYAETNLDGVMLACTQTASTDAVDRRVKCVPAEAGIAPFDIYFGGTCDDGGVSIDVLVESGGCVQRYSGS